MPTKPGRDRIEQASAVYEKPRNPNARRLMVPGAVAALAASFFVNVAFIKVAQAQDPGCDPQLLKLANGTDFVDYQKRPARQPNRCEGVYDPQKSAPPVLELLGYTALVEPFDPAKDPTLQLRWKAPPNGGNPHLRSYQLQRWTRQIYQMDTTPDAGKPPFFWSLDILRRIPLNARDVSLLAWEVYQTPRGARDIYLPIEATRGAAPGPGVTRSPTMTFMLNHELRRLTLTVEEVNRDLASVATLQKGAPLNGAEISLSANSPVFLSDKRLGLTKAGIYAVTLGADPIDEPNFSLAVYIYYVP